MNNQFKQTQKLNAEELLNKLRPKEEREYIDLNHEQSLRRALLNSRFFEQNLFSQYYNWLKGSLTRFLMPSAVLVIGFVLMIMAGLWINSNFLISTSSSKENQVSLNLSSTFLGGFAPEEHLEVKVLDLLQRLEEEEGIKFSHTENDGTRVYTMELVNSSGTIELYDPTLNSNIRLISK